MREKRLQRFIMRKAVKRYCACCHRAIRRVSLPAPYLDTLSHLIADTKHFSRLTRREECLALCDAKGRETLQCETALHNAKQYFIMRKVVNVSRDGSLGRARAKCVLKRRASPACDL